MAVSANPKPVRVGRYTLRRIGDWKALRSSLAGNRLRSRLNALKQIAAAGCDARPLINSVYDCLQDPHFKIRWYAIEALRSIGSTPSRMIPGIVAVLSDPSGHVSWRAAECLAAMGMRASKSLPDVLAQITSEQRWVVWHGDRTLLRIAPRKQVAALLKHTIRSSHSGTMRSYAAAKIATLGPLSPSTIRLVRTTAVNDVDPAVRAEAVRLLGTQPLKDSKPDAVELLKRTSRDGVAQVRVATVATTASLLVGRDRTEVLKRLLHDDNSEVRRTAAIELSGFKRPRADALKEIRSQLAAGDCDARALAALIQATPAATEMDIAALIRLSGRARSILLAETASYGVLPTVGLRLWKRSALIRFPTYVQPYPWKACDAYHSSISHHIGIRGKATGMKQVCIQGDWVPDIHYVWIADLLSAFSLHQWSGRPVEIESRVCGPVIGGGGWMRRIAGMITIKPTIGAERIDFLYTTNLSLIQELAFLSFVSAGIAPLGRIRSAQGWGTVCLAIRRHLESIGARALIEVPWYSRDGWASSHYGRRYETVWDRRRSFALRRLKESTQGKQVRGINGVIRSVRDGLLRDLWSPITDWLGPMLHELPKDDLDVEVQRAFGLARHDGVLSSERTQREGSL